MSTNTVEQREDALSSWEKSIQKIAWDVFARELEELLRTHPGKWVAYHGATRVCICQDKPSAYAECGRRGLRMQDLLVKCVHPSELAVGSFFLSPNLQPQG